MILLLFGWVMVSILGYIAFLFLSNNRLSREQLLEQEGVIAQPPEIFRDEYDTYNTGMKIHLTSPVAPIFVPGKILRQANQEILMLGPGTEIRYFIRKNPPPLMFEAASRIAFGIQTAHQTYYTPEVALTHFRSPQMRVYAILSALMGLGLAYLLLTRA